jgi:DNA-directed RNA polymerase specialized sigma24 family protein
MSDDRPTPAVLPRRQFTAEEESDLGNVEARASYWARQVAAEDRARADEAFKSLPVEERARLREEFLHGRSAEDIAHEVVHGKGEE